jgi:hypothetical protein
MLPMMHYTRIVSWYTFLCAVDEVVVLERLRTDGALILRQRFTASDVWDRQVTLRESNGREDISGVVSLSMR